MRKDTLEFRMMQERQKSKTPDSKLLMGSIKDKHPVILDGGKTTIFISDKTMEAETREKYELRRDNRLMHYVVKPKT